MFLGWSVQRIVQYNCDDFCRNGPQTNERHWEVFHLHIMLKTLNLISITYITYKGLVPVLRFVVVLQLSILRP